MLLPSVWEVMNVCPVHISYEIFCKPNACLSTDHSGIKNRALKDRSRIVRDTREVFKRCISFWVDHGGYHVQAVTGDVVSLHMIVTLKAAGSISTGFLTYCTRNGSDLLDRNTVFWEGARANWNEDKRLQPCLWQYKIEFESIVCGYLRVPVKSDSNAIEQPEDNDFTLPVLYSGDKCPLLHAFASPFTVTAVRKHHHGLWSSYLAYTHSITNL